MYIIFIVVHCSFLSMSVSCHSDPLPVSQGLFSVGAGSDTKKIKYRGSILCRSTVNGVNGWPPALKQTIVEWLVKLVEQARLVHIAK